MSKDMKASEAKTFAPRRPRDRLTSQEDPEMKTSVPRRPKDEDLHA
jgi:hypothetical protein